MRRPATSARALKATWLATRLAARFSTRLAGAFAARLWFTPWAVDDSPRSRTRHARWLADARPISIPFRHRTLAGFVAGRGPTILLVHGWGERAATLGALVGPLAAAGYRVVGVDLPAHGESGGRRTDLLEEAAAVRATIEHLGGVHAVIAHSMGGAVATLAVAEGARVERIVLIGSALRLDSALGAFGATFRLPPRAIVGLTRHIERRFGRDVWDRLGVDRLARSMEIPALVLHDVDDPQVSIEDGRALAASWPGARLVETTGLGHVKILGDRDVISAILEWLERAERLAG